MCEQVIRRQISQSLESVADKSDATLSELFDSFTSVVANQNPSQIEISLSLSVCPQELWFRRKLFVFLCAGLGWGPKREGHPVTIVVTMTFRDWMGGRFLAPCYRTEQQYESVDQIQSYFNTFRESETFQRCAQRTPNELLYSGP